MPKAAKTLPTIPGYEENLPYTGRTKEYAELITHECRKALINYYTARNMSYQDREKELLKKIAMNEQKTTAITRLKYYCHLGTALRKELASSTTKVTQMRSDLVQALKFLSEVFEKREEAIEGLNNLRLRHLKQTTVANMENVKKQVLQEFPHRTNIIIDEDQGTIETEVLTETQVQAHASWIMPFEEENEGLDQTTEEMSNKFPEPDQAGKQSSTIPFDWNQEAEAAVQLFLTDFREEDEGYAE
jgi:activator of 2-hydroxyglutaryl-CoA dehydratase